MNNDTPVCYGAGLVALDILFRSDNPRDIRSYVGGSCGNIMMILSYLGWSSFPIARLQQDKNATRIVRDFILNNVNIDFISIDLSGSTPIIIQRNLVDRLGNPKHRFEVVHPITGEYLPRYKSITKKGAEHIIQESKVIPDYFYFDRVSPGILMLVDYYKANGSIIVFEPSSRNNKDFDKALKLADILKFSDQRISDFKDAYPNSISSIEIETKGSNGLAYRCKNLGNKWTLLPPPSLVTDRKIIDTSGAGDWTTAGIIYKLNALKGAELEAIGRNDLEMVLNFGQELGAKACLYEGARGLMSETKEVILKDL